MAQGLRKARVAVVGTGLIGQVHIRSYQQHPLCEVVALCDRDPKRLQEAAEQFRITAVYTDQREMHARESVDGVVIATPDHLHREPVEIAAAAGVHVMLEKPIATTLADAEAIIGAADQAGVKLMLGFTLRWIPHYAAVHDQVAAGALGPLTNAYARRTIKYSEAYRLGGRCSVNEYLAVHDIDAVLWLFGREVESVYATRGDFLVRRDLGTADYYWNVLKFRSGATAVVHVSWCESNQHRNLVEMELMVGGERGSSHLTLAGDQIRFATAAGFETPEVALSGVYPAEAAHFVDCILHDRQPLAGGRQGMDALKVMLAAEESIVRGAPVPVWL